jgi:hypothetical protein
MGLRIDIASVAIKKGGREGVSQPVRLGCVSRLGRTYDCHAREDRKGEPGACYGRYLREPSFQADDGHGCAVAVFAASVLAVHG